MHQTIKNKNTVRTLHGVGLYRPVVGVKFEDFRVPLKAHFLYDPSHDSFTIGNDRLVSDEVKTDSRREREKERERERGREGGRERMIYCK